MMEDQEERERLYKLCKPQSLKSDSKIPDYQNTFEEIAKFHNVNLECIIDKIKAEITEHANEEIARLQAVSKDLEESMTEKFVEELVDAKKEIIKAADTEIENEIKK